MSVARGDAAPRCAEQMHPVGDGKRGAHAYLWTYVTVVRMTRFEDISTNMFIASTAASFGRSNDGSHDVYTPVHAT